MSQDKRTRARELAMQFLCQLDVQGKDILKVVDDFLIENEIKVETRKLAARWIRQTCENIEKCDELINSATIKWELSRLSLVDKSILRLSVYQIGFCDDIPDKVVINEAIELAKKYSGAQSPAFVNGVLDSVLKKIKQEDNFFTSEE